MLQAVTEASDDAIIQLDGDGRVRSWNRSAERIFGFPEAEILGQPVLGLVPEHVQGPVVDLLAAVAAGDPVDHLETEAERRDGMPVAVSITAQPVEGHAAVLVVREVTEQRLAQATLAEVERRLSEAEHLSGTGSWLWDRRTDSVQWSDEHHRIHGRDPLAFEGTIEAHLACIHPDDRDEVRGCLRPRPRVGAPLRSGVPGGPPRRRRAARLHACRARHRLGGRRDRPPRGRPRGR